MSKFVIPQFGFAMIFPHSFISGHFCFPQKISYSKSSLYIVPSSGLKHLYLRDPENICNPAIAKIIKTKIIIRKVSKSWGRAENKALNNTFKSLIEDIVRNGLKTRNVLKLLKSNELDYYFWLKRFKRFGIWALTTIIKSNIFHVSRIYAFLWNIKPNPMIFKNISTVYIHKKI